VASLLITSTSDISLEDLEHLTRPLARRISIDIDPQQAGFKSFDAPSFLHFLQEPQFWIQTLAGGVAVDLLKAGSKKAWRHRNDAAALLKGGADLALKEFIECLVILKEHYGPRTGLAVGCPIPDDWFGTLLFLEGDEPVLLCTQVALFLAHAPALEIFLESHAGDVATGFFLSLTDDGDMVVEWQDRATLKPRREILSLHDVA
jgi:hypothetical protein